MSDTNLSKNDLEAICFGLGISTEGTKADLIQKIRGFSYECAEKQKKTSYEDTMSICSEYPTEENEVHKLDPKLETLREMVQKSREKTKILLSRIDTQVEEGQSSQHQMMEDTYEMPRKSNKHRYQNNDDNEGPGALEHKMLL
ncbi:4231_t:CDS:1, partial [Racocetra persica]